MAMIDLSAHHLDTNGCSQDMLAHVRVSDLESVQCASAPRPIGGPGPATLLPAKSGTPCASIGRTVQGKRGVITQHEKYGGGIRGDRNCDLVLLEARSRWRELGAKSGAAGVRRRVCIQRTTVGRPTSGRSGPGKCPLRHKVLDPSPKSGELELIRHSTSGMSVLDVPGPHRRSFL
jgi:hypothetical protein